MKRHRFSLTAFFLAISIMFISVPCYAADQSPEELFLLNRGVPIEVIEVMTESQKLYLYNNLESDMTYVSYEQKDFSSGTNESEIIPYYVGIPDSEITISISVFKQTVDGEERFAVYPSFVWNVAGKLANDTFAIGLYPGWEVIPGSGSNMNVWLRNINDEPVSSAGVSASFVTDSGYAFTVPRSTANLQGYYEGHASFYMKKTNTSATNGVSILYVDDNTSDYNLSYSISIAYSVISIDSSVSSTSGDLRTYSSTYAFTY